MSTEPPSAAPEQRLSPTLAPQRVMAVIEALADSREGLTLTQLCGRTQLPKTSLFSLLRSLSDGGFVISEGKSYRLGPETYRIAAAIQRADRFPGNVRPLLEALQKDCGETVLIGMPAEDWTSLVYVDVVESSSWLRYSANVGAHRPMHNTSAGKVLLAYASEAQRQTYLQASPLSGRSAQAKALRKELLDELARVRSQGHVISSSSIEGATGMAAPVFGSNGHIMATVGTAGPSDRFSRHTQRLLSHVTACARAMSAKLGHPDSGG